MMVCHCHHLRCHEEMPHVTRLPFAIPENQSNESFVNIQTVGLIDWEHEQNAYVHLYESSLSPVINVITETMTRNIGCNNDTCYSH